MWGMSIDYWITDVCGYQFSTNACFIAAKTNLMNTKWRSPFSSVNQLPFSIKQYIHLFFQSFLTITSWLVIEIEPE